MLRKCIGLHVEEIAGFSFFFNFFPRFLVFYQFAFYCFFQTACTYYIQNASDYGSVNWFLFKNVHCTYKPIKYCSSLAVSQENEREYLFIDIVAIFTSIVCTCVCVCVYGQNIVAPNMLYSIFIRYCRIHTNACMHEWEKEKTLLKLLNLHWMRKNYRSLSSCSRLTSNNCLILYNKKGTARVELFLQHISVKVPRDVHTHIRQMHDKTAPQKPIHHVLAFILALNNIGKSKRTSHRLASYNFIRIDYCPFSLSLTIYLCTLNALLLQC